VKRKIFYLIPFIILVVGFITMQVLSSFKTPPPKEKPKQMVKIVEAQAVALGDVPAEIIAYGRLASSQPVILYSEVEGTLERGDLVALEPLLESSRGIPNTRTRCHFDKKQ